MSLIPEIAVLPLGAHEYHGEHLPLETDAIIVEGLCQKTKERLPAHLDVVFLETEKTGYSIEHAGRNGSRSLGFDEAIKRWIAIGEKLFSLGTRKFVLFNAHGGNSPLMSIVTTELRAYHPMLAVATSWGRFGIPDGLISPEEKALDIHGGFIETSVMRALAPEKVNMAKAEDFSNKQADYAKDFHYLRAYGPHAFGWLMEDLNKKGAAGNATKASIEAGEKMIDHAVQGFISLLDDVHRFDVSIFNKS